ncbi:MAG: trigger factor [delta proteobacterium ML8_F1]|nr:MAG: trigger factor [delta proteobacterium ML8_F1]
MAYKLLGKEKNTVKYEVTLEKDAFEKFVNEAYLKSRNKFNIPGFRKGKAPRPIIENQYGEGIFYDDALNLLIPEEYSKILEEDGLSPVDRPDVDIVSIGRGIDLKFNLAVEVKPEVVLGDYRNLEMEAPSKEVTPEELESEMKNLQEMNARMVVVEDREAALDDILTIDYTGRIDGELFEGGSAENQTLTLGSKSFIPGFEDQLTGTKAGDEVEVTVTFPEDYHEESLQGKTAQFEVKVHEIKVKELPELDDEFASDTSEFETLEELRADKLRELKDKKEKAVEQQVKNQAVELALEGAQVDIPRAMIDSEVDYMLRDMENQLAYSGISMEQYFAITGTTEASMVEQMAPDATQRVKVDLVLEAIAKAEAMAITSEEIEAELEKIAGLQNTPLEEVRKVYGKDDYGYLKESMIKNKVVDFLAENIKFK